MAPGVEYVCYIDDTGFYLGETRTVIEFLHLESPSSFMTTTWVPAQEDGNLTLLRTGSVRTLWQSLGALRSEYMHRYNVELADQTIYLFMPCGSMRRFIAFDDVPWTNTRCPCGHPGHWLIRYTSDPTS